MFISSPGGAALIFLLLFTPHYFRQLRERFRQKILKIAPVDIARLSQEERAATAYG